MIIDWKNLEIAEFISPEGLDLIRRLLDSNPNERYCYERMKLIKNHPYFNNIDWENCRKRPNPYLRSYVLNKIKQDKKVEIEKETITVNISENIEKSDYYTKKIENLYEKNKLELKKDLAKKVLEIDIDQFDTNFDDLY